MATYRDPNAPEGRVVFGGVAFHDGVTDDVELGPVTLELFASVGIIEVVPDETPVPETETETVPDETEPTADETPAAKPTSRRSK